MPEEIAKRLPPRALTALLKISLALGESLDLDVVMQTSIEGTVEVLDLETGAIYLLEGDSLYLGATTPPLPADFPEDLRRAALREHPHIVEAVETCQPVFVDDMVSADLSAQERAIAEARQLRSLLYVPLIVKGRAEGIMIVGTQAALRTYSDDDISLCRTLSAQVALSVANAQLFSSVQRANEEISQAYEDTLEGWSLALEMRDQETLGHTKRSAQLACDMAVDLGMAEEDVPHVRRGALLHDIGKMVVPDSILNKPGPLDDEEWRVMRAHPVAAQEFLSRIDYLAPAIDIPYYHHERWDGTGYPCGLSGEDIPLSARIFAVIDVYDALTSDRPYRRAWSTEAAVQHIESQSGVHFDPAVVAAFVARMAVTRH